MKQASLHKRPLCFLLCLGVILSLALPVCAKPVYPLTTAAPVHYWASSHSTVIGYMLHDTELTVLDRQGLYYRIDCYDMTGFIHKNHVVKRDDKYYVNLPGLQKDVVHFFEGNIGGSIVTYALAQVGVPYVSGGTSPRGFDCSGFTQYIYNQLGISIPRTCDGQLSKGLIIPKEDLKRGDLVLFQRTTSHPGLSTHVGIYLGNGKLIHAGGRGISVVDLNSAYFTKHYLCARRIVLPEKSRFEIFSAADSEQYNGVIGSPPHICPLHLRNGWNCTIMEMLYME